MQPAPRKIEVSIAAQELRLREGGELLRVWPVSTSKHGTGSEEGSFRTPLGRFQVGDLVGAGMPEGTIFKSRLPVGLWHPATASESDDDLVLTRILWLDGLDPENTNTRDRYIYIHGTNHEDGIGRPGSIGCVRMRNADVVELFDLVEPGTPVEIFA